MVAVDIVDRDVLGTEELALHPLRRLAPKRMRQLYRAMISTISLHCTQA
jgi:hypothetical protein